MRYGQHKTTSIKFRFILPMLFAVALIMQPQQARAQTDPVADAELAAGYALQGIQYILQQIAAAMNTMGQWVQMEGHLLIAQDQHDGAVGIANGVAMADISVRHSFTQPVNNGRGTTFCNRVMETQYTTAAVDAVTSVKNALQTATFWAGSCGDTTRGIMQKTALLCQLGFVPQGTGCQSSSAPSGYNDLSVFMPHVVIDRESYAWPSVLQSDGAGHLTIAQSAVPATGDMPALEAIMYCLNRHADTGCPVNNPNNSTGNSEQISTVYKQWKLKGAANLPDDSCLGEVAKRLVIPQNAGGNLTKVYNANYALCQQMQNKMYPQDYANCTNGTGVSYLTIMRAKRCKIGNPNYLNDRASSGQDVPTIDKEAETSVDRCDDFNRDLDMEKGQFAQIMRDTSPIMKSQLDIAQ